MKEHQIRALASEIIEKDMRVKEQMAFMNEAYNRLPKGGPNHRPMKHEFFLAIMDMVREMMQEDYR